MGMEGSQKQNVEEILQAGQSVCFHPTGGSMFPLFVSPADSAIVSPLPSGYRPKRLDVLLYRRPGDRLVIHRVYRNNKKGLYMIGDRQTKAEGPLPQDCVRGIMTGFIRQGKKYGTEEVFYRLLAGIWLTIRPVRHVLFKMGHLGKVFLYKIRGKEITRWY